MTDEARWRVDHRGVHDVEVHLPAGARIGDVASAILDHIDSSDDPGHPPPPGSSDDRPTLVFGGRPIPPEDRVSDVGPPAGSTIGIRYGTDHLTFEPRVSPVLLEHEVSGDGRPRCTTLSYGVNRLSEGVSIEVAEQVRVMIHGADALLVDGSPVRGNRQLCNGSLLRSNHLCATLRVHGPLRPPSGEGPTRAHPVARGTWQATDRVPINLPSAPGAVRRPGFPWLTATVPLLMAGAIWAATRSLLSVAFMGFSFVYVIAAGVEGRRESAADDRFRVVQFQSDLLDSRSEIDRRRAQEEHRDHMRLPSTVEAMSWTDPLNHRIWERSGSHPHPLAVRLGTALLAPDDPVVPGVAGRPELRAAIDDVLAAGGARTRPVSVDLSTTNGLAIVGGDAMVEALAFSIVAQLALLVPPNRLALAVPPSDPRWRWTHWLPHIRSHAPSTLFVVNGGGGHTALDPSPIGPLLWLSAHTTYLPESIQAIVRIDTDGYTSLQIGHGEQTELAAETVSAGMIEPAARRLAALDPTGGEDDRGLPNSVDLVGIGLEATSEAIEREWQVRRPGLAAPLGVVPDGGTLLVDLIADGPHALVAGTTGAGKSELLRSWLAGLAALHPPERVNFLLVDYKGGAAFGPLSALPHCVGLVTDLQASEVHRTLVALRAELRHREEVMGSNHAGDTESCSADRDLPALVVVIDEFATLVSEVPQFLDGVLDIAQRGRSLGIHMVLATQRPAGVVSDAIRANTSLRIALRLPDENDSSDVLDSPLAARAPRDVPGRAVIRLGHDELVTVQVAFSGAPLRRDDKVTVRDLGDKPVHLCALNSSPGPSQLEALVAAARVVASQLDITAARRPLAPTLPELLEPSELTTLRDRVADTTGAQLVIGALDVPRLQRRDALVVDPLRRGGVLVVGGPTSGSTSSLVAIASAADVAGGWAVHAIDATGALGQDRGCPLAGIASVRSVVEAGDHECVRRLLSGLVERIDRSKSAGRTLLVIDGFESFEQQQSAVNGAAAVDDVLRLVTEGRSSGIAVAVSIRRRANVAPALVHALAHRIVHRCTDPDEPAMWDAPAELADPDVAPGRAWFHGNWAQVALTPRPFPGATNPRAPRLARFIARDELDDGRNEPGDKPATQPWNLAVGVLADSLCTATVDLRRNHLIVAGAARSGRSTTLATLAAAARANGLATISTPSPRTDPSMMLETMARTNEATVGVIDDFDDWLEEPGIDELVGAVLRHGRDHPVRLVLSGDCRRLARSYGDSLSRLRSGRCGILLGSDAHERGDLLHTDVSRRDDLPAAIGRGWLLNDGRAQPVQIAVNPEVRRAVSDHRT